MAAYMHIHVVVSDPTRYGRYQELAGPTLKAHGARLLSKTPNPESLEGEAQPGTVVLLEFDDAAAAKRWYASPEYAEAIEARRDVATFTATLLV